MNEEKAQFLLTSDTKDQDMIAIMSADSNTSSRQFLSFLKYLGVFIGPDCHDVNWSHVSCVNTF